MIKRVVSIFLLSFSSLSINSLNIIFDMPGVLIKTDTMAAFRQVGMPKTLNLIGFAQRVQVEGLYALMNAMTKSTGNSVGVRDENNHLLPQLLCDWLDGTKSNAQMLGETTQFLQKNPHVIKDNAIRDMVRKSLKMMFTPSNFVRTQKIFSEAHKLVQELRRRGHTLFVLTNWDAQSFNALMNANRGFFSQFINLYVSGNIGTNLPAAKPYEVIMREQGLNARQCVYVSARPENLNAAQRSGMRTVRCTHKNGWFSDGPDFDTLRNRLRTIR